MREKKFKVFWTGLCYGVKKCSFSTEGLMVFINRFFCRNGRFWCFGWSVIFWMRNLKLMASFCNECLNLHLNSILIFWVLKNLVLKHEFSSKSNVDIDFSKKLEGYGNTKNLNSVFKVNNFLQNDRTFKTNNTHSSAVFILAFEKAKVTRHLPRKCQGQRYGYRQCQFSMRRNLWKCRGSRAGKFKVLEESGSFEFACIHKEWLRAERMQSRG